MSIANDIINGVCPNFDHYIQSGESFDDIDEYGFTPLIECAITDNLEIAEELLARKVLVNKPDVTGRTALHWAVDNNNLKLSTLLLDHGANPNAYTNAGLSVLVYPILRRQRALRDMLLKKGGKLDFALDFINAKLIGHRFELKGDVDIVNADSEFIELDFEGFILEFTISVVKDALYRFVHNYSARHLREHFSYFNAIINAFGIASELLKIQQHANMLQSQQNRLAAFLKEPMLILPVASRGHALCFVHLDDWWAKIDRGENSLKEGSVNIYRIKRPERINVNFLEDLLYKKQPRRFFQEVINYQLELEPILKLPISSQITGNCSWANVQAAIPVAYALLKLKTQPGNQLDLDNIMDVYNQWVEWDKDRALNECISRFSVANSRRRASIAAILGAILFQTCDYNNPAHLVRAEKILTILTKPEYYYILASYLEIYCVKRLTRRGNNLLKILDDCGVNPNIGVNFIATGLEKNR